MKILCDSTYREYKREAATAASVAKIQRTQLRLNITAEENCNKIQMLP